MIILISGKMYSGKDYFSGILYDYYSQQGKRIYKISFASKLKEYAEKYIKVNKYGLCGIPLSTDLSALQVQIKKDFNSMYHQEYEQTAKGLDAIEDLYSIRDKMLVDKLYEKEGARLILQKLGTDVVRTHYKESFWVDIVKYALELTKDFYDVAIIPDRRFDNEDIEGAIKINVIANIESRCDRADITPEYLVKISNHPSEAMNDTLVYDYILTNNNDTPKKMLTNFIHEKIEGQA